MKETFDKIIPWVFEDEGEFSDDEGDDGGPTRLGITIYDYAKWNGLSLTQANWSRVRAQVKAMPEEEVKRIYKAKYWNEVSADELPVGVDYFLFDCGLLSGTGTARRWLQRAVGAKVDGEIGPKTLEAISKDSPLEILLKLEAMRRSRLKSLSDWRIFGQGWTNRVNKSKGRALKLIEGKL